MSVKGVFAVTELPNQLLSDWLRVVKKKFGKDVVAECRRRIKIPKQTERACLVTKEHVQILDDVILEMGAPVPNENVQWYIGLHHGEQILDTFRLLCPARTFTPKEARKKINLLLLASGENDLPPFTPHLLYYELAGN